MPVGPTCAQQCSTGLLISCWGGEAGQEVDSTESKQSAICAMHFQLKFCPCGSEAPAPEADPAKAGPPTCLMTGLLGVTQVLVLLDVQFTVEMSSAHGKCLNTLS